MSDIPRPTIDELISRYMLEPSLRDVYVEGSFDKDLLSELARLCGANDVVIYDVKAVDVPDSMLSKHGLTNGNKQRVIALARELSFLDDTCEYRCIVDRDLDHWLGDLESTKRLVFTEFSDLESYYMTPAVVKHLMVAICGCNINDWDSFYSSFVDCLKSCYALRIADRVLAWSMSWISFDRCLKLVSGRIVFDLEDYVFRLTSSNQKIGKQADFIGDYHVSLARLNGDARGYVRGHDFVDLLAWANRKLRSARGFENSEAVQRILIASVSEVGELPALLG